LWANSRILEKNLDQNSSRLFTGEILLKTEITHKKPKRK
jgi:hypothetical protein